MQKTIFYFLIIALLNSCTPIYFKTIPGINKLNGNTTFAIPTDDLDKTNTFKELKYLLAKEGFNVVSIANARKAIEYKGEIKGSKKNNELIEIYSIKDLTSVYEIKMNGIYEHLIEYNYLSFNVNVIDMNSDKVVMWSNSKENLPVKDVLKKLVAKIVEFKE